MKKIFLKRFSLFLILSFTINGIAAIILNILNIHPPFIVTILFGVIVGVIISEILDRIYPY